jgi:diguanylate cyclase (GGDEF)-like protein/PAS domain S-box-containing protein
MVILALLSAAGVAVMAAYIAYLKSRVSGYVFNERNMADALNHVDAAIYMKDRRGRYMYANTALLRQRGISAPSLYGTTDHQQESSLSTDRFVDSDIRVLEYGETTREEVIVGEGPEQTAYLELKHPLTDKSGRVVGIVGISTDITELYRLRRDLEHAARTDELTGALNRRAFFEFAEADLAQARRYGRPLSMLIVDIDHFKSINDRFGHPVGDRVLRDVTSQALNTVRDVDRFARIGGEEFAVLLPETDLNHAIEVANRIRAALRPLALQADVQVTPTVSIGAATLHPEDQSVHDLYQRADAALYRAKATGRDRVVGDHEC